MSTPTSSGRIITFYSYKGGTGRSMALANIAWILASSGQRVLVVDWDLEAPGLHRYFQPFLEDKELLNSPGLIDYFIDFSERSRTAAESSACEQGHPWYEGFIDLVGYARTLEWPHFPAPGGIDFVPAGRQGTAYAVRTNTFNWQEFYGKLGGGVLLEALKRQLRADYDFVLIDSRTGLSDTSGVCTVQMPDSLVVCFTLNQQSLKGAAAVADSAFQQRRKPSGEPSLKIWPVPTRIDLFEKERLEQMREVAHRTFARYLGHLSRRERESYWARVQVLYEPFFAYEEILAPFVERRKQATGLLASLEALTGYLTRDMPNHAVTEMVRMPESARQEGLQLYQAPPAGPARRPERMFASFDRNDASLVLPLVRRLRDWFGSGSVFSGDDIPLGANLETTLHDELESAEVVLAFIGPNWAPNLAGDRESSVRRELAAALRSRKRLVPVLLGNAPAPSAKDLPADLAALTQFQGVKVQSEADIEHLIGGLGQILDGDKTAVPVDPEDPQKGQWGGSPARNGRQLSARVRALSADWFEVILEVSSSIGTSLTDPVEFHLHPTFSKDREIVQPIEGKASLRLLAWGAFTVGAVADRGTTRLELDLAACDDAPQVFRDR